MKRPRAKIALESSHALHLSKFLTVFVLFVSGLACAHSGQCRDLFKNDVQNQSIYTAPDGQWRPTDGDVFMDLRSNAPHFWKWVLGLKNSNTNNMKSSEAFKQKLLGFEGIVVGDLHLLNFGDIILANGKIKYGLVDIDDGGVAPLLADFVRYHRSNQVAPFKVDEKDLAKAYINGLQGIKAPDVPDILKDLQENYLFEKAQEKFIEKMTKGDRDDKFSDAAKVQKISEASPEVMDLYETSRADLEKQMPGATILDVGFRLKATGGSQGLPRFWYLIETNGTRHIIEFKFETAPATSQYEAQPDAMDRFNAVSSVYRPQEAVMGPYKIVKSHDNVFLMRERLANSIDMDPAKLKTKKQIRDAQELSLYLAYQIGQRHASQPAGAKMRDVISDNLKDSIDFILQLSDAYKEVMKKER